MQTLEICKEVFDYRSLLEAINAYKHLAKIQIVDREKKWCLNFYDCLFDAERTMKEFENYLIQVENIRDDNN